MWLRDRMVHAMRSFLNIQDPTPSTLVISKLIDEQTTTYKNVIWYDGQTNELAQLYKQLPYKDDTFWGSVQTVGNEIRKIHTGLPALMVNVLTNIIMTDYNGIDFDKDKKTGELFKDIMKDNKFNKTLEKAVKESLYKGDGAFKVSTDLSVSKYPIIEYFGKDRIEFVYKRGRLHEIIFRTFYTKGKKVFVLKETYGYGYITNKLLNYDETEEYEINKIPETAGIEDVEFDKSFMQAIPLNIFGEAIYDKKTDSFDSFDEVYSQWMNALRDGRIKTYIPESLIPRDKNGGYLLKPNSFDNKFIRVDADNSENGKNEIKTEQPNINVDVYMNTYITALDLCLQGVISPSTLGIDSKKITDPNATAQREKEKTTLWTRGKIVDSLTETLPELVKIIFYVYQTMNISPLKEVECNVSFGEYANPSFEAQVETVSKAKQGNIMSIETSIDELYGDTKDDKWKKEEVERLKNEQGIVTMDTIPAVNNVLSQVEPQNIEKGINANKEDKQAKESDLNGNKE